MLKLLQLQKHEIRDDEIIITYIRQLLMLICDYMTNSLTKVLGI